MAAESVGQIGLDLVVNKNGFEKQMSGITGLAKKAGAALAAAFAVKKIVEFGKACVDLGSDLAEVQNVVDVTFPAMTAQVDDFAKSAAGSFGLSETMSKKFTGTFGAMAKAFGFSESAAYDMSTTLTGLAGDVASFYNIGQDEAYTKLKSVFSGETETLKDLGIVMTQSALDAYALANGYGKTTAKMLEAEKVALRYKFVQEQLSAATGDFARTSDSWANQIRVLKLQFDSLKATIGQGLINVLTPVIKVINAIVSRLMTLANAFKAFTEMFGGKKAEKNVSIGMKQAEDSSALMESNISGAGAAAKKLTKTLLSMDNINILSDNSASTIAGGSSGESFDFGDVGTSGIEDAEKKCQALNSQMQALMQTFRESFFDGLGDISVFDSIKNSVQEIKDSLHGIFSDADVQEAAFGFAKKAVRSFGQQAGSFISIGASIADNLTGGYSGYLKNNSGRIQNYLVSMFDIGGRAAEISGNLSESMATVFESLRSDGAKRITESLIGIFGDAFMGITELFGSVGVDLYDVIASPFIDHDDGIKTSLEETFAAIAPIFEELKSLTDDTFSSFQAVYDEKISPVLMRMKEGLSDTFGKALEAYNTYIVPALEGLSERFGDFSKQHLGPLIEKFGEFAAKISSAIGAAWDNCLKPFADWFIENLYPKIAEAVGYISDFFFDLAGGILDAVGGIIDALGGLIDFVTGVFTGDWELAWTGIKDFFGGIWDALYGIVSGILSAIWGVIRNVLDTIATFFRSIWNGIKTFLANTMDGIYNRIQSALTKLKKFWSDIWTGMKNTVTDIFGGIWSSIKGVINSILGGVETMANGIVRGLNRAIEALNRISFEIPDWVPAIGGMSFGFSVPSLPEISIPKLAQGGYVRANTPQLAMIGDNRHQGEVVAPEDKIYEISYRAMTDALKQLATMLAPQQTVNADMGDIIIPVYIGGNKLDELVVTAQDRRNFRSGGKL